jgi:peptide/nickel transport system permease protein
MSQQESALLTGISEAPPSVSEWRRFRRVFLQRKLVLFGLIILAILIITGILAPLLAPHNPYRGNMADSLLQPGGQYLIGTDIQGRDILSRLIYGSRTALMVGFITVAIASVIGNTMGVIAGYFGGITNMVIMRIVDTIMCFPMLLLSLLLAAVFGGGLQNVIIAMSIAIIAPYARVMYGLTLSIKENDYIKAEYAMGASHLRIMVKHILPNAMPPVIVLITMQLGGLILAEATLSFIGIGIKPPGAAWGSMVADGQQYILSNPWISFAPGLAIMLVVFAFNMVGDGLRDALDPKLRGLL